MADSYYELIGLVPTSSDFTLERAVEYYSKQTFTQHKKPIRAELLSGDLESVTGGFRVWYGPWGITVWLECGPNVVADNRSLSEESDLPTTREVIAGCMVRLTIISDIDAPDFDNSDWFTMFTDQLRERFNVLLFDNVNGGWWT